MMAGLGFDKFLHDIGIDIDAFSTMTSAMAGTTLPFSNSAVVQPNVSPQVGISQQAPAMPVQPAPIEQVVGVPATGQPAATAPANQPHEPIGLPDPYDPAYQMIRGFEGYRDNPYFDIDKFRAGYGSDTYTTEDGKFHSVAEGVPITRADAERDLKRRVKTEFGPAAAQGVGEEYFASLNDEQRGVLTSVAYNYGSIPKSVREAAATGDDANVAEAIASLPANPGRRKQEAAVFMGAPVAQYAGEPGGDSHRIAVSSSGGPQDPNAPMDPNDPRLPDMSPKAQRRRKIGMVLSGLGVGFGQMSRGAVVDISDVLDAHLDRQADMQDRIAEIMEERRRTFERAESRGWEVADAERLATLQRELLETREANDDQNRQDEADIAARVTKEKDDAANANLQKTYDALVLSNPEQAAQLKPLLGTGVEGWQQVAGSVGDPATALKPSANAEQTAAFLKANPNATAGEIYEAVYGAGLEGGSDLELRVSAWDAANPDATSEQRLTYIESATADDPSKQSAWAEKIAGLEESGIPRKAAILFDAGVISNNDPLTGITGVFDTRKGRLLTEAEVLKEFGEGFVLPEAPIPNDGDTPPAPVTPSGEVPPVPTVPPVPEAPAQQPITPEGVLVPGGFAFINPDDGTEQFMPGANSDQRNAFGLAGVLGGAANKGLGFFTGQAQFPNISKAQAEISAANNTIASTLREGLKNDDDPAAITKQIVDLFPTPGTFNGGSAEARERYVAISKILDRELADTRKRLAAGNQAENASQDYENREDNLARAKEYVDQIAANLTDPVARNRTDVPADPDADAEIDALEEQYGG
jgi:GH24 family phage-related lysozyme (muramidase)